MLYLEEQASEETAWRYYDAVLGSCRLLSQQPLSGTTFPATAAGLEQLRCFPVRAPFEKYLIFYLPRRDGIEVVRVLHGFRDLDPILASKGEK